MEWKAKPDLVAWSTSVADVEARIQADEKPEISREGTTL